MNNKLKDKLRLLVLLDKVNIEQISKDCIKITCKEYDTDYKQLSCYLSDYEVEYNMNNIYNNGSDQEVIDMEQLKTLQEVVEELQKETNND